MIVPDVQPDAGSGRESGFRAGQGTCAAGFAAFRAFKVAPGVRTLAQMRAL